jgi:hypothetical protein
VEAGIGERVRAAVVASEALGEGDGGNHLLLCTRLERF